MEKLIRSFGDVKEAARSVGDAADTKQLVKAIKDVEAAINGAARRKDTADQKRRNEHQIEMREMGIEERRALSLGETERAQIALTTAAEKTAAADKRRLTAQINKDASDERIRNAEQIEPRKLREQTTREQNLPTLIQHRQDLHDTLSQRLALEQQEAVTAAKNAETAISRIQSQERVARLRAETQQSLAASRTRKALLQGAMRELNVVTRLGSNLIQRTWSFGLSSLGRVQNAVFGSLRDGWRRMLRGREQDADTSTGRLKGIFSRFNNDANVQGQGILSRLTAGRIAGIGALLGGGALGGQILSKGIERFQTIQDSTQSLTLFLQDGAKAKTLLEGILEVVKGTPFALDQFAEAGKNLVAFGIGAEKVPTILRAIGEAAAASGGGADRVQSVVDALGAAASQGKITGETLMRLGQQGIPALQILANQAGVTTIEMQKMVSRGAVPAKEGIDQLAQGILNGTTGINGATQKFAGTMKSLGNTLSGARSNFRAAEGRLGAAIITPLAPTFIFILNKGVAAMDALGKAYTKTAGSIIAAIKYIRDRIKFDLKVLFDNPVLKAAVAPLIFTLAALRAGIRATFNQRTLGGVYSVGNAINRVAIFLYDNVSKIVPLLNKFTEGLLKLTRNVQARGLSALLDPLKKIRENLKGLAKGAGDAVLPVLGLTAGLTATGAILSQLQRGNAGGAVLAGLTFGFVALYRSNENFRKGIEATIDRVKQLGREVVAGFKGESVAGGFVTSFAAVLGQTGQSLFQAGRALMHSVTALFRGDTTEAQAAADNFKHFLLQAFGGIRDFIGTTFSNLFANVDVESIVRTAHDLLLTVGEAIGRVAGSKEFAIAVAAAIGSLAFVAVSLVEGIIRGLADSDIGDLLARTLGRLIGNGMEHLSDFIPKVLGIDGDGPIIGRLIEGLVVAGPRLAVALGHVLVSAITEGFKFTFGSITGFLSTAGIGLAALIIKGVITPLRAIKGIDPNELSRKTGLGGFRENLKNAGRDLQIQGRRTASLQAPQLSNPNDAPIFVGDPKLVRQSFLDYEEKLNALTKEMVPRVSRILTKVSDALHKASVSAAKNAAPVFDLGVKVQTKGLDAAQGAERAVDRTFGRLARSVTDAGLAIDVAAETTGRKLAKSKLGDRIADFGKRISNSSAAAAPSSGFLRNMRDSLRDAAQTIDIGGRLAVDSLRTTGSRLVAAASTGASNLRTGLGFVARSATVEAAAAAQRISRAFQRVRQSISGNASNLGAGAGATVTPATGIFSTIGASIKSGAESIAIRSVLAADKIRSGAETIAIRSLLVADKVKDAGEVAARAVQGAAAKLRNAVPVIGNAIKSGAAAGGANLAAGFRFLGESIVDGAAFVGTKVTKAVEATGRVAVTAARGLGTNLADAVGFAGVTSQGQAVAEKVARTFEVGRSAIGVAARATGQAIQSAGAVVVKATATVADRLQNSEVGQRIAGAVGGGLEKAQAAVTTGFGKVQSAITRGGALLRSGGATLGNVVAPGLERMSVAFGHASNEARFWYGKTKEAFGKVTQVAGQAFPYIIAGIAGIADGFNRLGSDGAGSKILGLIEIIGGVAGEFETVSTAASEAGIAIGGAFGPVGIAIAAATAVLGFFLSKTGDATEQMDAVTQKAQENAKSLGTTYRSLQDQFKGDSSKLAAGVLSDFVERVRSGDEEAKKLADRLATTGSTFNDFADGVVSGGAKFDKVINQFDRVGKGVDAVKGRIETSLLDLTKTPGLTGKSDLIAGFLEPALRALDDPRIAKTAEFTRLINELNAAISEGDPQKVGQVLRSITSELEHQRAEAGEGRVQAEETRKEYERINGTLNDQTQAIVNNNILEAQRKTNAEKVADAYSKQKNFINDITNILSGARQNPLTEFQTNLDSLVVSARGASENLKDLFGKDLSGDAFKQGTFNQLVDPIRSSIDTALSSAIAASGGDAGTFDGLAKSVRDKLAQSLVTEGGLTKEQAEAFVKQFFDPTLPAARELVGKGLSSLIASEIAKQGAPQIKVDLAIPNDKQDDFSNAIRTFIADPTNQPNLEVLLKDDKAKEAIKAFQEDPTHNILNLIVGLLHADGVERTINELTEPGGNPRAVPLTPTITFQDIETQLARLQRDRATTLQLNGDTTVIDDQIKWLQATKLNLETSLVHKPGTKFLWWDWKKIDGSAPGGEAITDPATVPVSADISNFVTQIATELSKPHKLNVTADLHVRVDNIDRSLRDQIKTSFPNWQWFNGAAEGRIVTRDQIIRVGEENKPEVILPLTKPDRMRHLIRETGIDEFVMKHMVSSTSSTEIDEYQKRYKFRGYRDGGMIGRPPIVGQFKGWEFLTKPLLQFIAHIGVAAPDGPSPTTTGVPGTGISFLKGDTGADGAPGAGISWLKQKVVGALASWITEAISITGVPASWFTGLVTIAKRESGGNPKAINLWDSNAKAGHPSKGLMQTIDGTFNHYSLPGHKDIYNPVDNAIAAIRYILARYKDIRNVQQADPTKRPKGYDNGGLILRDQLIRVGERDKPELILPLTKPKRMIQLIREHGIDRFVERHHIRGYADGGFIPGKLKRKYEVPKIPAPKKRIPGKLRPPSGGPDVSEFDVSHWDPADPTDLADRNRVGEFADRGMGRRIRIARERTERHIIDLISNATLGHLRFRGPFPAAANVARTTPLDAIQSVKDQTSVGKSPLAALRRAGTYEVAAVMTQMFGAALGNGTKDSRDVAGSIGVASRVMADRISGIGGRALGELLRLQARLLASVATVRVGGDGRLGRVVPWEQLDPLLARQVPKFAQGGVILRDQLIRVGEENKPELILPLTKPQRMIQLIREHSIDKFVERHNIRGFATGGLVGGPAPTGRLPKVRKRKYDPNEQYVPGRREVLTDQWKADTATTKIMLGDIANTVAPLITAPTATPITRALRDILVNSVSERGLIKRGLDWHHFLFGYEGPSASLRRIVARTAADVASGFGSAVKDAKGDLRQRLMGIGAVVDTARKGFGEAWAEYGYPITNTLTRVAATAEPSEGPAWSPGKRTIESGALVGEINKRWAFFQPQIAGQNPGYRVRDDIPSVRDLAKFFGGIGGGGVVKGHEFGGVVTRDQIIRIAERNQPELVLPLTKPDRMWSLIQDTGIDRFVADRIAGLDGRDKLDLSVAVDQAKKQSLSSGDSSGTAGTVQQITYAPVTNIHTNVVDPASAAAYLRAENERLFKKLVSL